MKKDDQSRKKGRKVRIFISLTIIAIAGSLAWSGMFPSAAPEIILTSPITGSTAGTVPDCTAESGIPSDPIPIYLVGAVKNPGIYQVERGSYLYQLVADAGGLLETAAADSINLAMRLDDNQLIRIPTQAELTANPLLLLDGNTTATNPMIDLNKADEALLDTLPGVGPSTAKAIVEYRKENGPFKCVEDLMKVPGIKESRFNTIKDLVTT